MKDSIPLCVYNTVCLSTHLFLDTWVVSISWLLWIELLWNTSSDIFSKYSFGSLEETPRSGIPRSQFLGQFLIFLRVLHNVLHRGWMRSYSHPQWVSVSFPSLPTSSGCFFSFWCMARFSMKNGIVKSVGRNSFKHKFYLCFLYLCRSSSTFNFTSTLNFFIIELLWDTQLKNCSWFGFLQGLFRNQRKIRIFWARKLNFPHYIDADGPFDVTTAISLLFVITIDLHC